MSKLILEKDRLSLVEGIDPQKIDHIWKQLQAQCPSVSDNSIPINMDNLRSKQKKLESLFDICLVFSQINASDLASKTKRAFESRTPSKRVCLASDVGVPFDPSSIEDRVLSSKCLVVLLTPNCLLQPEVLFPVQVAQATYALSSLIILVQDVPQNTFSSSTQIPPSLQEIFSQQPIHLISKHSAYFERGMDEIHSRCEKELAEVASNNAFESTQNSDLNAPVQLRIRIYFSFKKTSGSLMATSLSTALSQLGYASTSSSQDSNNVQIVQNIKNADVFVFLLTAGVFESKRCLKELQNAIEFKKQILIVRDATYTYSLPEEWASYKELLTAQEILWLAEYNTECFNLITCLIGPPDTVYRSTMAYLSSASGDIYREQLKQGTLELTDSAPFFGISSFLFMGAAEVPWNQITTFQLNTSCGPDDLRKLLQLVSQCKNLRNLSFTACVQSDMILPLLSSWPHLEILDLNHCKFDHDTMKAIAQSFKLRSLAIRYMDCDAKILAYFAQHSPDMETLVFFGVPAQPEGSDLLPEGFFKLKTLDLGFNAIPPTAWNNILKGRTDLQKLVMDGNRLEGEEDNIDLSGCVNLQEISLKSTSIKSLRMLTPCKKLQAINLTWCSSLKKKWLRFLVENCKELERIVLNEYPTPDEILIHIGQHAPQLKSLELSKDTATKAGIKALVKGCPNLEKLAFSIPTPSAEIGQCVATLKHLKSFTAAGYYDSVTFDFLNPILENCSELEELAVNTLYLGLGNVLRMVERLPKLKKFYFGTSMGEDGLNEWRKSHPQVYVTGTIDRY